MRDDMRDNMRDKMRDNMRDCMRDNIKHSVRVWLTANAYLPGDDHRTSVVVDDASSSNLGSTK